MRFSVLGQLQVVSEAGAELHIPQARQRALLAVLLLHANQELTADRLTQSIWDQDGSGVGPGALRTQIWALRKLLAPAQRLHTGEHRGYLLEVRPGELDAARFRELAGQGRHALESADLAGAVRCLTQALGLWGDPPLADVPETLVMGPVAQRLLDERTAARELLTEARLGLGQHTGLIPELRERTVADPANERLWEQLMLALHGAGRTAEALAAYQQARASMQAELGLEPGHSLQQLHQRILADDPELGRVPVPPAGGRENGSRTGHQPARGVAGPVAGEPDGQAPGEPDGPAPGEPDGPAPGGGREDVVPRQLPVPVRPFVGREDELAELDHLLDHASGPAAVVISAIGGTAGVGKTALAVHWAHQVAGRFPDGQLYVNLRGFDPSGDPTPPATAIRELLDALNVPAHRIPASLDAQAGLFRSIMAGKRILLVLDNARDAEQVRPLLPGSPGCMVVVTSRSHLGGLAAVEGAHSLRLGLLTDAEARALLAARLGPARTAAEPGALAELAGLCARLPLALAIVSARAGARAGFPLAAQAAELRDSADRLDVLEVGDPAASVRSVFSWSYRQLDPAAARLFRLLGLHPGPDISAGAAASLAGCERAAAGRLLATLTRAHLLTEHLPGRYACHDLLRAYAVSLAEATDTEPSRRAAAGRVLDHYLHTAHTAALLINPSRTPLSLAAPRPGVSPGQCRTSQQALAWFDAEHHVLLAAVTFAAETDADLHACQLAWTLADFLDRRGHWAEEITSQQTALHAATRLGDSAGQAAARLRLGHTCTKLTDYPQARAHATACLELNQQIGNSTGQARAYQTLSYIASQQGRHAEALSHGERGLQLLQATGNLGGQAVSLNDTGWCHAQLGNYQQAQSRCEQALAVWEELGDRNGVAHAWDTLGYIAHCLGKHAGAIACYQHALELFRDLGDLFSEAEIQVHLGDTHHSAGQPYQARVAWQRALDILTSLDHPHTAQVSAKLWQLSPNGAAAPVTSA